jgi:hypothetical protein
MHQNRMELRTRISQAVGLVAAARRQWQWLAASGASQPRPGRRPGRRRAPVPRPYIQRVKYELYAIVWLGSVCLGGRGRGR